MIGKKDNCDIFRQYKSILLEQVEDSGKSSLLNRVKASSLDSKTKNELLQLLGNPMVQQIQRTLSSQEQHGMMDADAAGYASYPEAVPVSDQDDEDTVNKPDPEFAKELAKERKEQEKKYPYKAQDDEESLAVADIKKELNAAIAAGDQKKANELFSELQRYGKSDKMTYPSKWDFSSTQQATPLTPDPEWHKKSSPSMVEFGQAFSGKK